MTLWMDFCHHFKAQEIICKFQYLQDLLKWSRVLRSSPFRILNSLEQEFDVIPEGFTTLTSILFNDEKHARANVPQILVEIRNNCLFDGNLFYYIQKRGS